MLGQPRKYGCHQKKLPPIPLRGSYDALKSSRYCPVPRATVQFLALLSSFLALLSSFLALLSSSSCYCPVPRATVQFLALLSSFLELLSSPYFSFSVYRKQGTFLYFFFSSDYSSFYTSILILSNPYIFSHILGPYTPCQI